MNRYPCNAVWDTRTNIRWHVNHTGRMSYREMKAIALVLRDDWTGERMPDGNYCLFGLRWAKRPEHGEGGNG